MGVSGGKQIGEKRVHSWGVAAEGTEGPELERGAVDGEPRGQGAVDAKTLHKVNAKSTKTERKKLRFAAFCCVLLRFRVRKNLQKSAVERGCAACFSVLQQGSAACSCN